MMKKTSLHLLLIDTNMDLHHIAEDLNLIKKEDNIISMERNLIRNAFLLKRL